MKLSHFSSTQNIHTKNTRRTYLSLSLSLSLCVHYLKLPKSSFHLPFIILSSDSEDDGRFRGCVDMC